MKKRITCQIIVLFLMSQWAVGQDIEHIKDQKPFTIHGSVGGGMNFFSSNEKKAAQKNTLYQYAVAVKVNKVEGNRSTAYLIRRK